MSDSKVGLDTFTSVIENLRRAGPRTGIRLVDVRFRETFHPYTEIHRRVLALEEDFRAQGLRRGDTVLCALRASVEVIASLFALIRMGGIPYSVPSPLLSQDREAYRRRIRDLVDDLGIDRLLGTPDLVEMAEDSERAAKAEILAIPEISGEVPEPHDPRPPADLTPDDTALVQFSSGSTSRPKGIRITHRNLVHNLGVIVANDRRTPDSVMVSWLPLCHDMGLIGCLMSNLIPLNHLVLMDPLCFLARPISWLSAITRSRGTTTAIPNFALDICTDRIPDDKLEEAGIDLSTFRYIYCGAEPVHPDSIRRFESRFSKYGFVPGSVYPVYGMSETTLITSAPDFDDSVVTREIEGMEIPSVGFPLDDFQVAIRDEDGADLPAGRIGEICIRGTSVTTGYITGTAAAEEQPANGWLATGDLGILDDRGRMYITGRIKDLIIHQGRNFYGHDLAARIGELPFVRRGKVHVFAYPVGRREEVVVMTAPPARGYETASPAGERRGLEDYLNAIRKFVLAEFGIPVYDIHVVKQIPRTTSGKIDRGRCLRIYREEKGRAPGSAT